MLSFVRLVKYNSYPVKGHHGHDCMVLLDLILPVQSVLITTKVMSSNPVHGEVYSRLCGKVCQGLTMGRWFSPRCIFTDFQDLTEIALKMTLLNAIKYLEWNPLENFVCIK